jgi:hypothetical protein
MAKVFWNGEWHIKNDDGTIGPRCERPDLAEMANIDRPVEAARPSPPSPASVDARGTIALTNVLAVAVAVFGTVSAVGAFIQTHGDLAVAGGVLLLALVGFAALRSTSVALALLAEIRDTRLGGTAGSRLPKTLT